jgi:hypothetical protein
VHTYASISEFKDFLRDGGSASSGGLGTTNDGPMLTLLEGASRTVDAYCDRSQFGTGFGPRVASNRYDAHDSDYLNLEDDFLAISAVTVLAGTGGTSSSLTEETDYYTQPYGRAQKRRLQLNRLTSGTFPYGIRTITVAGSAGYQDERETSTTTVASGLSAGTTATTFTTSASPTITIGQTLLVGTEQLYLTGLSATTATVVRASNGTTAATHVDASTIAVYRYPREVRQATLLIAQRRWRSAQAGVSGDYDGQGIPGGPPPASEMSILRSTVGHLRIPYVG